MKHWLLQVLIALDQLVCAVFGGWADETCSSCLYRLDQKGKPAGRVLRPVVDWLALHSPWHQTDHCKDAYDSERIRAQLPPELRTTDTKTGAPLPQEQ